MFRYCRYWTFFLEPVYDDISHSLLEESDPVVETSQRERVLVERVSHFPYTLIYLIFPFHCFCYMILLLHYTNTFRWTRSSLSLAESKKSWFSSRRIRVFLRYLITFLLHYTFYFSMTRYATVILVVRSFFLINLSIFVFSQTLILREYCNVSTILLACVPFHKKLVMNSSCRKLVVSAKWT